MSWDGSISVDQARRLLGVSAGCTPEELRAAYRASLKRAHPDQGGTDDALRLTLDAYRLLEGREAAQQEAFGKDEASPQERLEITPVIAVVGGRIVTRLADGTRVAITVPAGLRNGDRISAKGAVLGVVIKGRPELFVSGDDLCMIVRTTEAVCREGGRLKIKTPAGSRLVWVPRQVGMNRIVRIAGQGLPPAGRHRQGALVLKLVTGKEKESPTGAKRKRFSADWATA